MKPELAVVNVLATAADVVVLADSVGVSLAIETGHVHGLGDTLQFNIMVTQQNLVRSKEDNAIKCNSRSVLGNYKVLF